MHGSDRRYSAHTTENAGAAETTLYAATLNNMAGTYRQMQDYDRAIDLYLKARKLYHNICGRTIAPYIGSLNNLSLAYREAGQPELALSCLEEAVETYTKILGPDHERTHAAEEDLFHLRQKVAQMRAQPLTERSDDLRRTTE